jgi:hypothetical protein
VPQSPALFTIYPVASGSCVVTFTDSAGDSVSATVSVNLASDSSVLDCPALGESGVSGVVCTYHSRYAGPYAVAAGPSSVCTVTATAPAARTSGTITAGVFNLVSQPLSSPCTVTFVESDTGASFYSTVTFTSSQNIACPLVATVGTTAVCSFGDFADKTGVVGITATSASGKCQATLRSSFPAGFSSSGRVTVTDTMSEACIVSYKDSSGLVTATLAFQAAPATK